MRIFILAVIVLFCAASLQPQGKRVRTDPGKPCGDLFDAIPLSYYEAVADFIEPEGLRRSVIRIVVGKREKLALWTDGEKFRLSAPIPQIKQENIYQFLSDLDRECHLPPYPRDAADLIKVKWEHKELSGAEFAQMHEEFATALAQYVVKIQNRYSKLMAKPEVIQYLHTAQYPIAYYNNHEEIEVRAWNSSENDVLDPMAAWVHKLQRFAAQTFHRKFGDQEPSE